MTEDEQQLFYIKLGSKIKDERLKAEIKQEAFASFLNLSRASIVNIEKGRQRPPIHLLWSIAKILNIEVMELLPQFNASDVSLSEWKKKISTQVKSNKENTSKILGFIEKAKIKHN
ncbi:DNA-binding XRE family transcriptional regulator [Flavobacterium chryseum]|uniref:helix-turn-helix domain-containing protein n=1 Tax=Flavobacterium sp. P3160 TaxID=2512113 RepID=UPI001061953D|nr:helix-turn-helix transcriptional regulator [Flavobacterium sp. P3160]TDO83742.1 DNA-binding XRE family transcriptional regulator [Flavobacterium sp. P3160]